MSTRPGRCTLVLLSLALTALFGTHADRCESEQQGTEPPPSCPQGWELTPRTGMCLKTFFNRLNWSEARLECQNEGADLVRVFYDSMRLDIKDYIPLNAIGNEDFWIALTYSEKRKRFTWPNEEDTHYSAFPVPYYPRIYNCVKARRFPSRWINASCTDLNYFSCEIVNPDNGCPRGWGPLATMGDLFCIRDFTEKLSYSSADSWCGDLNSTVVTVKWRRKHLDYLDYRGRFNDAWVGVTDQEREGHYVWATGGAARFLRQYLWVDGTARENCLYADSSRWRDADCSDVLPFICQKQATNGLSSPVMEVKPRLNDVSPGLRPHKQNVYFVGDHVNVTCRALRVRSGKLAWTFVANGSSGPPIFQDLDNYIDNYVEMVYIPHANACMEQTVSTFFTTAVKEMTNGYLSCFSLTDGTETPCIGTGDPMEYCITSSELKILDGPEKGPELKISPSDLREGDKLVALCKVYPGEGGSLVWVIYPGSGDSRTLENHVDTEIASEISTLEDEKLVTISQLEFTVNTSFDGSRIACFAYDIRKTDSLECPVDEELCAISPPFHVTEIPLIGPDPYWKYMHKLFFTGFFFCLAILFLAALLMKATIRRKL